jgi:hypothetical protein
MVAHMFSSLSVAAATCLLISSAALAEEHEFAGTYKLISATRKIIATGQIENTFGKEPMSKSPVCRQ